MGLQTGTKLASTKAAIIDPSNLKTVAYEIEGPLLTERPSIIRIVDVRELSDIGMIIDSSDEFIGIDDVIAIEKIYKLGFKLIGLDVIDETKRKLGKVTDYSVDVNSFIIQQLNVSRGILKSLSEPELLVHRTQIIEINNRAIIVRAAAKKLDPITNSNNMTYLNPFRSGASQTENTFVNKI